MMGAAADKQAGPNPWPVGNIAIFNFSVIHNPNPPPSLKNFFLFMITKFRAESKCFSGLPGKLNPSYSGRSPFAGLSSTFPS